MTNRIAYIILTDDGIDQIVEGKAVCARELRDLRDMDVATYVVDVPWNRQDEAVAYIDELIGQGSAMSGIARVARQDMNYVAKPAAPKAPKKLSFSELVNDAKKIKGVDLRDSVHYILAQAEINANDCWAEKATVWCVEVDDFVTMSTDAHWEQMAIGSITSLLCDGVGDTPTAKWFVRRGIPY